MIRESNIKSSSASTTKCIQMPKVCHSDLKLFEKERKCHKQTYTLSPYIPHLSLHPQRKSLSGNQYLSFPMYIFTT